MKRAHLLSALGAPLFLALSASPVIAFAAPPIDFETGFSKGMTVDKQFEQSHGIQFSIVNMATQAVTYPVIAETYDTDPGCGLALMPGSDAGCGPGAQEGWVYTDGILPVKGMTKSYYDRLSSAKEPVSMKTHAELVGRYAMVYPTNTDASAVYLRILYTNPTKMLSFGIIDVDQGVESWSIEARDANDVILVTEHVSGDPNNYLAGDGEIRFVNLDVSASASAIKEVRVQQTGTPGAGLGFDAFSTIDIPSWVCGDSAVAPGEGCDDGNTMSGDGCSQGCQPEQGYTCTGEPSKCEAASSSSSGSGSSSSSGGGDCEDPGDPCGCSCEVAGGSGGERGLAVIALAALASLRWRRSRGR